MAHKKDKKIYFDLTELNKVADEIKKNQEKRMIFPKFQMHDWIRFKPFSFNSWRLFEIVSRFIIKRRFEFLDKFFCKCSVVYYETRRDFYDTQHTGKPFYDWRDFE